MSDKVRFLEKAFGKSGSSSDGRNYSFKCPKCRNMSSEKKKLVIRIDNEFFQCWVCDLKGRSLYRLFKNYRPNLVVEYQDIFGNKKTNAFKDDELEKKPHVELPRGFKLLGLSLNDVDPDVKAVIRYARSRGLNERDFWYYKLGVCKNGRFRRRIIMPSFDAEGELNYYVARSIDHTNTRKYINPKVSKKDIIFNELNIKWDEELTIVEGPFDLVKCDYNTSALLGSHLNESYLLFQQIIKNQTPILLALDPDAMGKSHKYAGLLSRYGINVRIMKIENYEDVGAMQKNEFMQFKNNALPWRSFDKLYYMISKIESGSLL